MLRVEQRGAFQLSRFAFLLKPDCSWPNQLLEIHFMHPMSKGERKNNNNKFKLELKAAITSI